MSILSFEKTIKPYQSINYSIPDIQREANNDNIIAIFARENDFFATHGYYILPGSISIAKCLGAEYIIDGQHRMAAYNLLSINHPERPLNICVDYYHLNGTADLEYVYKMVNTSTPNDISRMSIDFYKIKKEITAGFKENFQSYIKNSAKPIPPNISLDLLHNKIDSVDLSIFSLDEVGGYIIELNTYYANCPVEKFQSWHVDTKYIHNIKQRANQLYLGLYREYEYIDRIIELKRLRMTAPDSGFADIQHYNHGYRPKITKMLRRVVWNSKQTEQSCYCCGEVIRVDDFHCGHVIPLVAGGATNKDNLRAICAGCNHDMGVINMEVYKKILCEQLV